MSTKGLAQPDGSPCTPDICLGNYSVTIISVVIDGLQEVVHFTPDSMAPYQRAVLEEQDAEWAEYFMAPLTGEESEEDVMKKFYKMTSQPLQVIMMIYRVNIQVVSNLPYEAHVLKRNLCFVVNRRFDTT